MPAKRACRAFIKLAKVRQVGRDLFLRVLAAFAGDLTYDRHLRWIHTVTNARQRGPMLIHSSLLKLINKFRETFKLGDISLAMKMR